MCNCSCENSAYFEPFERVMQDFEGTESQLIPILQRLQQAYGYLPEDVIQCLSKRTGIYASTIMGVATFYAQFKLTPAGEHTIKLCFGTACHVNGAETVAEALCDELKIDIGGTTADGKFTLESVACLGCCSLAPVMMIDDKTYGRLTADSARQVIRTLYAEFEKEAQA